MVDTFSNLIFSRAVGAESVHSDDFKKIICVVPKQEYSNIKLQASFDF